MAGQMIISLAHTVSFVITFMFKTSIKLMNQPSSLFCHRASSFSDVYVFRTYFGNLNDIFVNAELRSTPSKELAIFSSCFLSGLSRGNEPPNSRPTMEFAHAPNMMSPIFNVLPVFD